MAHGQGWSVVCVTPGKVWVKTVHRWGDARQAWRTMCRLHIHEG